MLHHKNNAHRICTYVCRDIFKHYIMSMPLIPEATICSTLPYSVLCIKCSQLLARGLHLPSRMHHSKLMSYLRENVNAAFLGLMGN